MGEAYGDGGGDSGSLVARPNPSGSKTCSTGTVDIMGTARRIGFATAPLFELVCVVEALPSRNSRASYSDFAGSFDSRIQAFSKKIQQQQT